MGGIENAEQALGAIVTTGRPGGPQGPDPSPPNTTAEAASGTAGGWRDFPRGPDDGPGGATGPTPGGAYGSSDSIDGGATQRLVQSWLRDRSERAAPGIALNRVVVRESAFQQRLADRFAGYGPGADPATDARAFHRAEANGLVLVRVPIDGLVALFEDIAIEPVTDSGWLGVLSAWRPLIEASRIEEGRRVQVGRLHRVFAYGRFRLLSRAFPVQTLAEGEVMRVELLPHFHQPRIDPMLPDWEAARYAGEILPSAAIAVHLRWDEALVICGPLATPTDAGVTRSPNPEPGGEAEGASGVTGASPGGNLNDEEGGAVPPPAVSPGPAEADDPPLLPSMVHTAPLVGPEPDRILTVGEELLRVPGRGDRAILVIIPHGLRGPR